MRWQTYRKTDQETMQPTEEAPPSPLDNHEGDEPFPYCDRHPLGAYCSCKAGFGKCQNCDGATPLF